jgi:hypothetical protein
MKITFDMGVDTKRVTNRMAKPDGESLKGRPARVGRVAVLKLNLNGGGVAPPAT